MRAVAVYPQKREVKLIERAEPRIVSPNEVRIRMLEVGVCGTDKELCAFVFGTPPPGSDHYILGHESLGEVSEVGCGVKDLRPGDLVVGSVRLPCADAACQACRTDHQDFCSTGKHREHGIKSLDGFMADVVVEDRAWLHLVPPTLREVAVLVEPLTIAEKSFHEAVNIQSRLPWNLSGRQSSQPRALVLGAGAVGLLGAMKLIHEGYQTYVYSRQPEPNPKATIAKLIGAVYISSRETSVDEMAARVGGIDLVYEALGAAQLAFDVLKVLAPNGVYAFTGIPRAERLEPFDTLGVIENLVLRNQAIVGIVNAGPQAFADAVRDLSVFHARWPGALEAMITGRYPMEEFLDPVMGCTGGIKNVIRIG
jgi:threonine dehydrogenase-like Zn-dependent dehydrogenase